MQLQKRFEVLSFLASCLIFLRQAISHNRKKLMFLMLKTQGSISALATWQMRSLFPFWKYVIAFQLFSRLIMLYFCLQFLSGNPENKYQGRNGGLGVL